MAKQRKRNPICKDPSECTHAELADIVRDIQEWLWCDTAGDDPDYCPEGVKPDEEFWDPDKQWDSAADILDGIADAMSNAALVPESLGPVFLPETKA